MIGIKTKSLLGLLLISLLLPIVSFAGVTGNYGAKDNIRSGPGRASVNLDTLVNAESPAGRLISRAAPQADEQLAVRNWQQIPQRVKLLLSSIQARLRAIFDPAPTNSQPVAEAQSLETTTNQPLEITLSGSDEDIGDTLTYQVSLGPNNGILSGTPPVLTYTPNDGFSGQDSFLFTVNDGSVISDPALVTIDVVKANEPPVANALPANTAPATPLLITLSGSDPDNDPLTFELTGTGPTNGSLSQDGDGPIVTYTPNMGFIGHDSFGYIVNDGQVDSAEARVDITIELSLMEDRLNPLEVDDFEDFGWVVDISGTRAIVSAPYYGWYSDALFPGAAYIYRYDGNSWQKESVLVPSNELIYDTSQPYSVEFAYSVAIEGDVAVVGDPRGFIDAYSDSNGIAYVFNYRPGWGWQLDEVLHPDDNVNETTEIWFGTSVDITRRADGGYRIAVGAPWQEGGGAVYSYESSDGSGWVGKRIIYATDTDPDLNIAAQFGAKVALDGTTILIDSPISYYDDPDGTRESVEAAYILEYIIDENGNASWENDTKLISGNTTTTFFSDSLSLSLSGDVAVIGAFSEDAAYIFKKDSDVWQTTPVQVLTGISRSDFGASVAVENGTVLVGAPAEFAIDADDNLFPDDDYVGAVYVFEPNADLTSWIEVKRVSPEIGNRTINDMFGHSVAASEDRFIVGVDFQWVTCPGGEEEGCTFYDPNFGSAYIYAPPTTRIIFRTDKETVPPEDNLTLSWTTIGADDGTINIVAGDGTSIVENGPVSGSITIPISLADLNTVKTYTATADGPKGLSNQAVIDITVAYPLPTIDFAVSPGPDPTDPSANAILTWIVTNADPSINGTVVIDQGIGSVAVSGSMPVTIASDTTYTITATNPSYTAENAVSAIVNVVLPTNLVLTNNPAAVAGNDVTISWEPNGTATALFLQELDGNGDVVSETLITPDPFNTTSYTFTPNPTSTYRLRFSTDSGSIFQDITVTILDPANLGIAILTPPTGATINKPFTNVTGLVTTAEDEVGVVVNGIPAMVVGNRFYANNIPLDEGTVSLEVTATEPAPDSNSIMTSQNVSVDTTNGEWIVLEADPNMGLVDPGTSQTFAATARFTPYTHNPVTAWVFDCYSEPTGAACSANEYTETQVDNNEYDLIYKEAGIYKIVAQVVDDQSKTISQDFYIKVDARQALDSLLQARWGSMKTAMSEPPAPIDPIINVTAAVKYFTESSKDNYTTLFTELTSLQNWQSLFSGMNPIEMIYSERGRSKYRITRYDQDIDGIPETVTYYIYFDIDATNGLWKIDQF